MAAWNIYWGESHCNTDVIGRKEPPLGRILRYAATYLDFFCGAYYTSAPVAVVAGRRQPRAGAFFAEGGFKPPAMLKREWAAHQEVTAGHYRPGRFVTFPGYEWQGDGRCGDHNVFYPREGLPLLPVGSVAELYAGLRKLGGIAIPHHTAYLAGHRSPDWAKCDDGISPFAEIYSAHGSSENDDGDIGLRHNPRLGPGATGRTYEDALRLGLRLGASCSTDNWGCMPGCWGQGLMACLAANLTRRALWDAFLRRRVYGVSGDRIRLDFTVNGAAMGGILPALRRRAVRVHVEGADALELVEILRDDEVIHCHRHPANCRPPAGGISRYKLRVEAGWGPWMDNRPRPVLTRWNGRLELSSGVFTGWEPCWISHGQKPPELSGRRADFTLLSSSAHVNWHGTRQNAHIFEFQASPEAVLSVNVNGINLAEKLGLLSGQSRILYDPALTEKFIRRATGLSPDDLRRPDIYYHHALKAKLHRLIPESAYTAQVEFVDDDRLARRACYRVRVRQRNGQRAWSRPIWMG